MTLKQLIDKYAAYIDNLKFKDLHKQLVDSQDIFKLDDNVIENLNKLLIEEVGIGLFYEAEEDSNYVMITNQYCQDLCTRNNSPFVYKYIDKIDKSRSALALFNALIDSDIHTLFDYIIDSDNDKINVSDARSILGDYSKTKSLELSMDYSGGLFQIVLNLLFMYDDYGNFNPNIMNNICFIFNLPQSFGYAFSKNYYESNNSEYAINDANIKKVIDQINSKIVQVLK